MVGVAALGAVLSMALAGAFALRSLGAADEATTWVDHTVGVIDALTSIRDAVTDIETGQRGYVLTGDARYLAPDERHLDAWRALARARRLTEDNPAQQARLAALSRDVGERLTLTEHAEWLVANDRRTEAATLIRSGRGREVMERVRRRLDDAITEERRLVLVRRDASRREFAVARTTIVLTLAAGALGTMLAVALLRRETVRLGDAKRSAQGAEQRAIESEQEAWEAERRARASERLALESEMHYRLLFEANPVPAWVYDEDTLRFLAVNPAACAAYGWSAAEFAKMTLADIGPEDDRTAVREWAQAAHGRSAHASERLHRTRDGRVVTVSLSSHPLRYRGRAGRLVLAHDVTELRRARAELAELAVRDELTALLNRRGFRALAEQEIKVARRTARVDAVLYLDLDGFKLVNDTHGHAEGDVALQAVAAALRATVRDSDVVARLGGDEFAVYAPGLAHAGEGRLLAARISAALAQHSDAAVAVGRPYRLGASVGVAELEPGDTLDALLARADAALYVEKTARRRVA